MKMYNSIQPFAPYPNGDTEYFNIKDGVLQRDSRAPRLFIITLHRALRALD